MAKEFEFHETIYKNSGHIQTEDINKFYYKVSECHSTE